MTRILAFRHVPFEDIGLIRPALDDFQIDCADLYQEPLAVDPAAYDALIFMGGPMSVNDDLPFIHEELALIRRAAARRQPVLGICLGAQLIAKAMGARVYRNPSKEVGWFPVHFTPAAARDSLFQRLPSPLEVLQWHGETFDLPPGAVHLAASEACPHQAFRLDRFYALQYHLEVTPDMIADWCVQDANCGDVRDLTAPIDPHRNEDAICSVAIQFFRDWGAFVRSAS